MADRVVVPIKEFAAYFTSSMKRQLPDLIPRIHRLRVSGFPYCGLRDAYNKITDHVEPDGDAMKDFYCSVGTTAHETFQRFLGSAGQIYGDWKCRNTSCQHVVKFSCKNVCPKCDSEMEYVEFTVYLFTHVSGHTDGLFLDKAGSWFVIDYKTSSVRVIESQKANPTFPYASNKAQIESYVVMLEELLGITIEGWMLIYIARDRPSLCKVVGALVSDTEKQEIYETIYKYDRQYDTVINLLTIKQLHYLERNKLCRDREHYINDVKGFKACPLEAVCFTKQLKPLLAMTFEEYLEKLE